MGSGRVLLMPSAFHPHQGGVEELTLRLSQELARRGEPPLVLTNRWPRDLPAREGHEGVTVLRHPMRPGPGGSPRERLAVLDSRRREQRLRHQLSGVRLVHVQCVSTQAYLAQRLARDLDVPLVVTLQGELTMDATGIYRTPGMMRAWHALLDTADAVSGCSQFVVDEARTHHPRLRDDAVAIANGVHTTTKVAPIADQAPYLFAVGRHVPQKGFDLLLDALTLTKARHRLVLGGNGSEHGALQSQALRLGLGDRVTFTGALSHEEVLSWCAGAEAFVLPSRHEPQGIVVLEAMSVRTLVLAAAVGGVPEMVRPGETGFLFEGSDPGALARAIDQHVGRDHESVIRNASNLAADHSWSRVTDRYEELYALAEQNHARASQSW